MKKLFVILLSVLLALPLFACNNTSNLGDCIAEYGAVFTLPYLGEGNYKVSDSKGESVDVSSKSFVPTDENGYLLTFTNGNQVKKMKINVVDSDAPVIHTEYNFKYVLVGDIVQLPEISAYDGKDGEIQYSYQLKYNNQEVIVTGNTFVAENPGIYTLTVSAVDQKSNLTQKNVYYESRVYDDGLTEVIASFSTPYGPNHIGNSKGLTPSFNEDKKFGNESGSLKLEMNGDQWFAPSLILMNFAKTDLSDSFGFLFRIYNDMDINISFAINWVEGSFIYSLPTNVWTEIYISRDMFDDFANTTPEIFKDKFSINDITGMYFAFYAQDSLGNQKGLPRGSLYFSNILEVKNTNLTQLSEVIEGFDTQLTDKDELSVENVMKVYEQLSETAKRILKDDYNDVINSYGDYLITKYGSVKNADTLIYFDSEVCFKQVTMGMVESSVANNPYKDNKKELKIDTVDGSGGKFVQFDTVFGASDIEYTKIVFDVYVVDTNGFNVMIDYVNDSTGILVRHISLNQGHNQIEIDLSGTSIVGGFIQIYAYKGIDNYGYEEWEAFPAGMTFYISSIKGVN